MAKRGPPLQPPRLGRMATSKSPQAPLPENHSSARRNFPLSSARSGDGLSPGYQCLDRLIGGNDLMIAAIAQANGLTLVTHNTAEFGRIASLMMQDWQT